MVIEKGGRKRNNNKNEEEEEEEIKIMGGEYLTRGEMVKRCNKKARE